MSSRAMTTPTKLRIAKYAPGRLAPPRFSPFGGVVFDIARVSKNPEGWYQATRAEVRPKKDQPFYHLYAENSETEYVAYVSEQNLLPDTSDEPIRHPRV